MAQAKVPKAMEDTYNKMAELITNFCEDNLNDEYLTLCLKALEMLCRKRPSPLLTGRLNTWAAGIIYAIGQANFIFDKSQPIHLTADEIAFPFDLSKTTVGNKAAEVRKILKIRRLSPEWMTPYLLKKYGPSLFCFPVDFF